MKTDNLWKQYLNDQPLRKALILADLYSYDIGNQIFLLCCDDYFKIQKESRFLIIAYLFLIPDISPLQLNVENLSKKVTTENGIMQKFNYELKDKTYEKAPAFKVDDTLKNLYGTVLLDLTNGNGANVMTSKLSFGTLLETYRVQNLTEKQWATILLKYKTKKETSDTLVVKKLLFPDWSYDTDKYKGTFTGSQILEKSINSHLPDMWDRWFKFCTETQKINPELFSLLFTKLFPSLSLLYSDLGELGKIKENQFKFSPLIPTREQILTVLNDPNIVKKLPVDVIKKFEEKRKKTEVTLSMLIDGFYPEK